jgi:hypothetical protein
LIGMNWMPVSSHLAIGGLAAGVAIVIRRAQERLLAADERVIDRPRIDAHTDDGQPARGDQSQAVQDVAIDPQQIPALRAEHADRAIGKAVDFLKREPLTIESSEHDAPAFRAEIAGDVVAWGFSGHPVPA